MRVHFDIGRSVAMIGSGGAQMMETDSAWLTAVLDPEREPRVYEVILILDGGLPIRYRHPDLIGGVSTVR